ncbi:MAG: DUF166 domain-containing protein [Candidatus Bathyarchaeota archaeon]|nr:DUF166 domain-containing protein [Candidatus Bathyarchaeota archaeon]MDH5494990.1 DUF166 domain-containing protein [Candidatus Bathyarchaeota archaeon]
MQLCVIYNDEFAERVMGNLINTSNYCKSCGFTCAYCRQLYSSFAADIQAVYKTPTNLPAFVDEPEKYLPHDVPNCDVILAIGLHPDILASIPTLAKKAKAKAIIVPLENRNWCHRGLQRQLEESLNEKDVEYAFPKPFCMLQETGKPAIDSFVWRYQIGKPLVEVKVERGRITDAQVLRSAPCGSTWYVAQQIKWTKISDIEDTVAVAHHAFPCTASMDVDPEIGQPILHVAGFAIREVVKDAIKRAQKDACE